MNNFLDFINSDIESKKTFIQSLPTNNKTNQKKYNQKVSDIIKTYNYYKDAVTKYINAKSESFKYKSSKTDIDKIGEDVKKIKDMLFIFNSKNTYKEKLHLDEIIYNIHSYSEFTFQDINIFINSLVDKFKKAGVVLSADDFVLTPYVNKYMSTYFDAKGDLENLSKTFENIYWHNHDIIKHIELSFIILIEKFHKNFDVYISNEKIKILDSFKLKSKDELIKKYNDSYSKYCESLEEDISDIVEKAKTNDIDINNYFEDSKFRSSTFTEITVNEIDYSDEDNVCKLLMELDKLKTNIIEYKNYLKFMPLFNYFKENYSKMKTVSEIEEQLKKCNHDIASLISKIEKKNGTSLSPIKKISTLLGKKTSPSFKFSDQVFAFANQLYDLYIEKNKLLFEKNISSLQSSGTVYVSDVMDLFYSHTYFKIQVFKEVFESENSSDLSLLCDSFDEFVTNPNNVITKGINIFEDLDMSIVISDKYRMENINLLPEDLEEDNLDVLINKVDFIKRIYKIEKSNLSVEKIWFIVQNEKLLNAKKEK